MEDVKIINSEDSKSIKVQILKQKCNFLYKTKRPFTLYKSGSTYHLKSGIWNEKAFKSGFEAKDLSFIKSVKNYVVKSGIAIDFLDNNYSHDEIEYIRVNRFKPGDVLNDLLYIDINSAYWHAAFQLNVISKEIYEKALDPKNNISKVVRLAALGSLAKRSDVWSYDGSRLKKLDTIKSYDTENVWFAICKRVSDVMTEISKKIGNDFVFYWVDGIYVKKEAKETVQNHLKQSGFSSKMEMIEFIKFEKNLFQVKENNAEDTKKFNYSINKKKSSNPITKKIENYKLLQAINNSLKQKI